MSVSVALSFPAVGSVVPEGGATVAVLARLPVAEDDTVPVTIIVALDPEVRVAEVDTLLPLPEVGVHDAHDQLTPVIVAGTVSVTDAPDTSDGPLLVTTIV